MPAFHPKQVKHTLNFFRNFGFDDNLSCKRETSILVNQQKSIHESNRLGIKEEQTEDLRSEMDRKKASLSSRVRLNTAFWNRSKMFARKPIEFTFLSVPSFVSFGNRTSIFSPTFKPKRQSQILSNTSKVKGLFQTLSPSKTSHFTVTAEKPECVKQEPLKISENDHNVLTTPQKDLDVKSSPLNFAETETEICESFVAKVEPTPLLSIPGIELKTEEGTESVLTSEVINLKRDHVNASNNRSNNNKDCGNSKVKLDPKVGNDARSDQTKIKTSRSEAKKYDKLLQLYIRKKRFAISNDSGLADQDSDLQTSTTAVRRKIVFPTGSKMNSTKSNMKIPSEKSNGQQDQLNVVQNHSGRINTNFTLLSGGSCENGVKPQFSFERPNPNHKERFIVTKRDYLRLKRQSKRMQRTLRRRSVALKMYKNWGVSAPSDRNTNLSVASYIRCHLSKLQGQNFQSCLEGEKISTLANVESGRKRTLSIDNNSESQQAKRCRLMPKDNNGWDSGETSILDFRKNCISKLESLENEWNEIINLEIETTNRDYKCDLRQLQRQQRLENYTVCLKHSNHVYNKTIEKMARKHWKEFRQLQNNFLLKVQNIEEKRHMRFAALRNEFREACKDIQIILNHPDYTKTQMLQSSPSKHRRISVDTAVRLVKEDKIYNSFYTE